MPIHSRTPLFGLLTGNAISMVGNMMTLVAIPWFVLHTTGSAAKTGVATAVASVPMIIGGAFGGALVDRFGFKRVSIAADLASTAAVMLIPLLYSTIGLAFWQLLVLVFMRGLLDTPGNTARTSLLPDLADLAGMPRERANAALQGVQRGATLVGPPIAGALIGFIGPSNVLWIDAASFAASALLVSLFVPPQPLTAPVERVRASRYARELRDGLAFLRANPLLLALALASAASNFFDGYLTVAAPVYAKEILRGAADLGLMFSALGAGGLVGIVLFGRYGVAVPKRLLLAGGFAGIGLGYSALIFFPALTVALLGFFVAGLAAGPINPAAMTLYQERVPMELRGRVFGLLTATAWSVIPVGRLVGGYQIDLLGLKPTIAVMAGGYLLVALSLLLLPIFSEMDSPSTRSGHGGS